MKNSTYDHMLKYLDKPKDVAEFLDEVIYCDGPAYAPAALHVVSRSKALKRLAKRTGKKPSKLKKALRVGKNPSLTKVCNALEACGLTLSITLDPGTKAK